MVQYTIGDIINAYSTSNAGEGAVVVEYEWKWNGIIINNVSTLSNISFDTSGQTEGNHILSLRILNDCGSWSNAYNQSIELVEPYVCPVPTVSFILA